MKRTDEQVIADDNLTSALQRCIEVYSPEASNAGFIINDFVVLASINRITDDGTLETVYPAIPRDGDMPWYRIVGLIEIHNTIVKQEIAIGMDNG